MTDARDLLPELDAWNEGRGVPVLDWLWASATSDMAVAFSALFWPSFVIVDGHVLRSDYSPEIFESWRAGGHTSATVETGTNYLPLGDLFSRENGDAGLIDRRVNHLGAVLAEIYRIKLSRDFPDRRFEVRLLEDPDDYSLTFHQA